MNKLSVEDSALAFLFGSLINQVFVGVFFVFVTFFCALCGINFSLTALQSNCWGYLACMVVMNLGLFLVFLIFRRKKDNKIISKPKFNKVAIYVGFAIVTYLLLFPIVTEFNKLLIRFGVIPTPFPYKMDLQGYLVSIFSLAILPAVFEELLFRGIILKGLKQAGKTFSIVMSAVMFALFHLSISQTIYPLLMGLLLGGIMYKENNILYTIIVHFVSNFITLTLDFFNISLNYYFFAFVAIILMLVFLTLALIYAIKGNRLSPKQKLTTKDAVYLCLSVTILVVLWIINSITILL